MKRSLFFLFASLTFLVACGQKGALYFAPENAPEVTSEAAPTSASKQNDDKSKEAEAVEKL